MTNRQLAAFSCLLWGGMAIIQAVTAYYLPPHLRGPYVGTTVIYSAVFLVNLGWWLHLRSRSHS